MWKNKLVTLNNSKYKVYMYRQHLLTIMQNFFNNLFWKLIDFIFCIFWCSFILLYYIQYSVHNIVLFCFIFLFLQFFNRLYFLEQFELQKNCEKSSHICHIQFPLLLTSLMVLIWTDFISNWFLFLINVTDKLDNTIK